MMKRIPAGPINATDAPVMELPPTSDLHVPGARRRVLAHDPETKSVTYISELSEGFRRPTERDYREAYPPGRFEYHTCHEEGFILDGRIDFGGWYDWTARAYFNHPSTWNHPADQCAPEGATLLVKLGGPLDFVYSDIAEDWDRVEFPADPDMAAPHEGVTSKSLDRRGDGTPADAGKQRWTRIWHDTVSGWTTWLLRVGPGWQGTGEPTRRDGGDELFVLSGDLTVRMGGGLHTLRDGDYCCRPESFEHGGAEERSDRGCEAVRWTCGVDPMAP